MIKAKSDNAKSREPVRAERRPKGEGRAESAPGGILRNFRKKTPTTPKHPETSAALVGLEQDCGSGEALPPPVLGGLGGFGGAGGALVVAGAAAVAPTPPFFLLKPRETGKNPPPKAHSSVTRLRL